MCDESASPVSPDEGKQVSPTTEEGSGLGTRVRQTMEAWNERSRDELHSRVAARSAQKQRDQYRADREAEGRTVRLYRWHKHGFPQPGETPEDVCKRMHRDRQRSYRGTAGKWFGDRADVSAMSDEERKQHVRSLAADRQRERRQRIRESQAGMRDLSADDLTKLDEVLNDLVLD